MENKILEDLLEKAQQGDAQAQCSLGDYYECHDNEKSTYWFAKAAEQNCLEAIYSLADHYLEGIGIEKDEAKALSLYHKCTKFQNIDDSETDLAFSACADIARFYYEGIVVEKNIPTAIEWFLKADKAGVLNPSDFEIMATYYEGNDYGEQNLYEAARCYIGSYNYGKAAAIYRDKLKDFASALYWELKNTKGYQSNKLLPCEKIDYNNIEQRFKSYYLDTFSKDIQTYYKLELLNDEPILFSPSCRQQHRKTMFLKTDSILQYHFFSLTTYFISLFPQVIGKLLGYKYAKYFFMATGWPWLNCGMGGMLSPIDIICESDLRPANHYLSDYLFIFNKVKDYMLDDLLNFLKGNHPSLNSTAYQSILDKIQCEPYYMKDIETECLIQFNLYMNWIVNPQIERTSLLVKYEEDN